MEQNVKLFNLGAKLKSMNESKSRKYQKLDKETVVTIEG